MELQIDSKDKTLIRLVDKNGKAIDSVSLDLRFSQSERLLQEINGIFLKNKITKESLERIAVNCGPGSYTGIRVGVVTANFLAFSLNIPIVSLDKPIKTKKKFQQPVLVVYLKEPFITKEKPRLR